MIRNILYSVFVFGLLMSCEKNKVEDPIVQGSPVFKVDAIINGESLSIAAGENGYTLSTFTEMKNGVSLFSGKLANNDIEIGLALFDGHLDMPILSLNALLGKELVFYSDEQEELLELSKYMFPNHNNIQEIKWYVDGVLEGINNLKINQSGKYLIRAEVTFGCGDQSMLCNEMIVGHSKSAVAQVKHHVDSKGHLTAWIDTDGNSIDHVEWKIDGENVAESNTLNYTVGPQSHILTALIFFQNGVTREKSALIDGQGQANFLDDFSVFENTSSTIDMDYSVILKFKRNGINYSSENVDNQQSSISINSITYFGKNTAGFPVYKINAQIDCLLGRAGTSEVVPFQGDMNFGIEVDK